MHPLERNYTQTLKEDRESIILCDELGYHDAFVGEHLSDQAESITNSMLFLATLINATSNIKLATGTTNLTHTHPVLVAVQAAMFDHLAEGRFILGVSPGVLLSDQEVLGQLGSDLNKIFADAINVILEIWERDPPYDINLPDNPYKVTTEQSHWSEMGLGVMPKPYQVPRPEIVGTVVAPYSKGIIEMGKRDFHPLSANFLLPIWVATHWNNYKQGCEAVGRRADHSNWRIARTIFVAEDDDTALRYGKTDPQSPFNYYYRQMFTKLKRSGRHVVFKHDKDEADEKITIDRILDDLVICGSVNKVVDDILEFRETVGNFGELVIAGMDWVDEDLTKISMRLMAEQVMPRVNEALT